MSKGIRKLSKETSLEVAWRNCGGTLLSGSACPCQAERSRVGALGILFLEVLLGISLKESLGKLSCVSKGNALT